MPSIDERVVSMAFENATFERNVAVTMSTLSKLNTAIANTGQTSGISKIETDANKVTLAAPMSALDKLKAKLGLTNSGTTFTDIENASSKVNLEHPMSALDKLKAKFGSTNSGTTFTDIENASGKVNLEHPMSALDRLKAKLGSTNSGTTFTDMENASNKVTLEQPSKALDNLKNKLNQTNAGTTFTDMENAGNRVSLSGLTNALDGIKTHLSGLETAAAVAFGNIASQATQKGLGFLKGFTFAPVMDGLHEYETNLKAIQTIQANTDQPLTKINKSLDELNRYSDQTIYNFGEMARNIGTFTAAGVDLKTATSSIKGIANMAALSGSNSQQASTAMYQLSQSIASGKVGLQDWNSVVNAGMGGKKLQSALATTAIAMGDIKQSSVKLEGPLKKLTINGQSFRESISSKPGQKPWLSSDVLVNTLATLDGRFSKAALSAELTKDGLKKYTAAQVEAKIATNRTALEQKNGVKYTDAQFAALMKLSDSAFKSATEVKTLGQVFDVAKETIGSGWSASFQSIFGNLTEAKTLFTGMSNTINGFINANSLARNSVLHDWKALGGRTDLIEGIKNGFKALISILKPIKDAFREVFPAKTGKDLASMTEAFRVFMHGLILGKDTMVNLKRTFAGVFAVLHIGWTIIKDVGKVLFDLLGVVGKGSGGLLNFTGGIGDFLVGLDKAISKGNALGGFFKGLENVLRVPLELVKGIASAFAGLFGGFDGGKADDIGKKLGGMKGALTPLEKVVNSVKDAWKTFSGVLDQFKTIVDPWFEQVKTQFSKFGDVVADGIKNANFEKILLAFQTTFLGGIFLTLKKAFGGGKKIDLTGGLLGSVKETLGAVTGQLTAMQQNVKAESILKIAGAIVILAAGIYVISTIEPKKLASSMTAIAVGLGEMGGALKIIGGGTGAVGLASMPVIAASMLILAGALVVLAAAMKIMASMSWEEMAKGLVGVGGAMVVIAGGLKLMPAARILPIAAGLLVLGIALNIIAIATKIFAEMKWEELAKGLLGMGGALVVIGGGLALIGPSILIAGPGLVAAAIGMTLLAGAVSAFGAMDMGTLAKGILGAAAAVAAIGLAMAFIPPTIGLQAAGLILLGIGLTALGGAVAIFGNLKIATLVKGIVAIGASLLVLAVGLTLMAGTLPGSLALVAAGAGLSILVPAIALMGNMAWGTILKGLAGLALSMGVIAVVGLVAAPALLSLGSALLVLGAGLILIGASIYLAAKGLSLLGENGTKGIAVLVTAITAFVALLPTLVINFVKGLVSIVEEIAKVAPKVVTALASILTTVYGFIISQAPKMGQAITALITAILQVIANNAQPMITAGWKLLQNLLTGISNNIGSVVTKVGTIITKFLNAFAGQAPKIIQAGAKLLGSFLGGIATALPTIIASAAKVVGKFLEGVTKQLPGVVSKGAKLIVTFLNEITKHVPQFATAGAKLIVAVITGIGNSLGSIIKAGVRVIRKFLNGVAEALPEVIDAGFKAIVKFLHGIANAIRENDDALINAGADILDALIDGVVKAAGKLGGPLKKAIEGLFGLLPHWARKILGIHSPSKVFEDIGKYSLLGLKQGLDGNHQPILNSATNIGNGLIGAFTDVLQIKSPSKVLKEIGKEVGAGFKEGLDGSASDIQGAFSSLKDKIRTEMENQRQAIKDENGKLKDLQKQYADKLDEITKLRSAKKPDKKAISAAVEEANQLEASINASERALGKYRSALSILSGANTSLTKGLQDEKRQLQGLAKQYDEVSKQLDAAKTALDEATKARDSAIQSYTDQYSALPDFSSLLSDALAEAELTDAERRDKIRKAREEADKRSKIDQVANYKKALAEQIVATKKYNETLQKLRALGLDDATYKKLLEKGIEGQSFADQLLAGGKGGIADLNKMDAELLKNSTELAKQAAKNLYQAGVDAAQGLVNGLKAKVKELAQAMDVLAGFIVNSIKRKLGIKSPSKEFADVGKASVEGLVEGLKGATPMVAGAAGKVGDATLNALSDSMSKIPDAVSSEIDTDITITPVLDLSQIQKDANSMNGMFNSAPSISANTTSDHAAAVMYHTTAKDIPLDTTTALVPATTVNFEQHNYSPDPLSNIEIYRQTNNQLSRVQSLVGSGPGLTPQQFKLYGV